MKVAGNLKELEVVNVSPMVFKSSVYGFDFPPDIDNGFGIARWRDLESSRLISKVSNLRLVRKYMHFCRCQESIHQCSLTKAFRFATVFVFVLDRSKIDLISFFLTSLHGFYRLFCKIFQNVSPDFF